MLLSWQRKWCKALLLVGAVLPFSCAYRLSNLHANRPHNIQTLAVEGIYDTSGQALPHELLWTELQKAFARGGHLRLVDGSQADAVLRAHLKQANVSAGGDQTVPTDYKEKRKDPKVFDGVQEPPTWDAFRDLTKADKYFHQTMMTYSVRVEIWHLSKQVRIFDREYGVASNFASGNRTGSEVNMFLRHEEAFQKLFGRLAREISEKVAEDLLIN